MNNKITEQKLPEDKSKIIVVPMSPEQEKEYQEFKKQYKNFNKKQKAIIDEFNNFLTPSNFIKILDYAVDQDLKNNKISAKDATELKKILRGEQDAK